jgi:protein-S-isoprenylcysteine O-methyltransferase Ste14
MEAGVGRLVGQIVVLFVILGSALFLPAGGLGWPAGWIFLILFLRWFFDVNVWLLRHEAGLMRDLMNLDNSDRKGWSKALVPLLLAFSVSWLVFMSFDAARFHWSPVPFWLQVIGAAILLGSFYLVSLALRENASMSTAVRSPKELARPAVSTGPYHHLRHPIYTAIFVLVLGTPLLLGSWYGVLPGLIFVVILASRAMLDERRLRKEMPGYTAYMARVKYRFIPYVW